MPFKDIKDNFITGEGVQELIKKLNEKNSEQTLLIYNDVNGNSQKIKQEESRAIGNEQILQSNIDDEIERAKDAEKALDDRISLEVLTLNQSIETKEINLQNSINNETNNRINAINSIDIKYDERISGLDSTLRGYSDTQINSTIGILRTEYQNADQLLHGQIDSLNETIQQNKIDDINVTNALNDRITAEINNVEQKIIDHNSQYTELNNNVNQHIADESNPHKVTLSQIGGASQADLDSLEERVAINEKLSIDNEGRLNLIEPKVEKNISDIEALQNNKINYNGNDQIISGGLISDGDFQVKGDTLIDNDLRVVGNLIVDGIHQIINTETLQVKDNFIVVNSDNEILGTTPAGIAIQTGTSPYLIAYDIENKSVSLGIGTQSGGTFGFAEGERKPILTRANSNQLQDKHLLIWDAETNTAIDGGVYDDKESLKGTFVTLDAYNDLVDEVKNNDVDITNLQVEDVKINSNVDQIKAKDLEQDGRLDTAELNIDNLETFKQNISDSTLKTTSKTIPTAINEIHDQLEVHENSSNNPHNVTWNQIISIDVASQGTSKIFNNVNPLMDGEATPGSLTTIARSDHKHPTDTTRAPIDHASESNMYGQATTTKYGHVMVDSSVNDVSVNPVQNKAIKEYIDDKIAELNVPAISLQQSETISNIFESEGKISVAKQAIQISQNQVANLPDDLINIKDNSDRIESESKDRDLILQNNIDKVQSNLEVETNRSQNRESELDNAIKSEASIRTSACDGLQQQISDQNIRINNNYNKIIKVESDIVALAPLNTSLTEIQRLINNGQISHEGTWALSFTKKEVSGVVKYEPVFNPLNINLDQGDLDIIYN